MIKIEFKTDNAAFVDDPQGELGRIVKQVRAAFYEGVLKRALRDSNENVIGMYAEIC